MALEEHKPSGEVTLIHQVLYYRVSNIEVCDLKVLKNIESKFSFENTRAYFQEKVRHEYQNVLSILEKKPMCTQERICFLCFLALSNRTLQSWTPFIWPVRDPSVPK